MKESRYSFIILFVLVFFMGMVGNAHAARILFVGNSFTGFSVSVLESFAQVSPFGVDELEFEIVGGTNLQAHTIRPETLETIQCKRFDYIVFQDHSQRTILEPDSFVFGVSTLVSMARANGAQPLLFETWARARGGNLNNFVFDQSIVSSSYEAIGAELDVPVIHVGDVWSEVRRLNSSLFASLYQSDLIHPSLAGQYAVASSVYRTLYPTNLAWAPSQGLPAITQNTIRLSAVSTNTTTAQHANLKRPVCEVSRNAAQRTLCGCDPKQVISPILELLLK